jgi:hypothetical protein
MKRPYKEGTVFLVPLRDGGYARGIVARSAPKGKILFGYFFGPSLEKSDECDTTDLTPGSSILQLRFGDLGLVKREWHVCCGYPCWDKSDWPMPEFLRTEPILGKAWFVKYSDDDPSKIIGERAALTDDLGVPNALYGYGAVEIELTDKLLKK